MTVFVHSVSANQDYSMLAAIAAVGMIVSGATNKAPIWKVNTEMEYHEEK